MTEAASPWKRAVALAIPWFSLASGLWSAFFIVRRYEQAQRLAWLLGAMWLFIAGLAFARSRLGDESARRKQIVVFAATWAAQSASQEIMFFVLPFWIRSTTWNSPNALFTAILILLAVTVLVDPIYQRILQRMRLAVFHKSLIQFAALAFLVPVATGMHTLHALALAGGLAGSAAGLALGASRRWVSFSLGAFAGAAGAVAMSGWIAPVPLRVEHGVFASGVVHRMPRDTLVVCRSGRDLWAWTPVFAPSGMRDSVVHSWWRDGRKLSEVRLALQGGRSAGFRTWSVSGKAAAEPGAVVLEVRTIPGQIVGRMSIPVR
ncbi:MAG TPA: DUF5924 family protein [Fibrobacteria bacterium]|nr:DUF5924 family protein [Fibrobacteria bacterium]